MSKQQPMAGAVEAEKQKELIAELVDHDINDHLAAPIADLLTRDFPLANLNRDDREYYRLLQENIALYVKEQFPPEQSLMQGDVGAALLEEPDYRMRAMTEQQRNQIETLLLANHARSSRGLDGWQQDKISENIETQRVEDLREEEEETGVVGRVFS